MDQKYGDPVWRQDDAAATAEAIARIRAVAESGGNTLDFSDLTAMTRLPGELALIPGLQHLFAGDRRADGDITPFNNFRLTDLTALRHLTALTTLDLSGTPVTDLAPLAHLTAMTALHLSGTQVTDFAPLARLTALTALNLSGTQVTDLAPLAHLTALTALGLSGTQITDIAPIARLTALTALHLIYTQVTDLAPLARLTALTALHLSDTRVTDLAPLARLTALTVLDLSDTQVFDLSVLLNLPEFAAERGKSLVFARTPAADPDKDPNMETLAGLPPKRCAIETVQYLKGTHPIYNNRPNGKATTLPARLAQASPVGVDVVDGQVVAVNTGAPERLAPRELDQRLTALRAHVAGLCDEAAELQVPQRQQARFRRYAQALEAPEPTYLLLDTPMLVLRTALDDPYATDGLEAAFVAGWRAMVQMHDDLRPLLLPPDATDLVPDLDPKVTPEAVAKLADEMIEDLQQAVQAGAIAPSVTDALAAGKEMAELAKDGAQVNPGRLKRGAIVLGSIVAGLRERFVTSGKVVGAVVAWQKFIESPWGQKLLLALESLWKFIELWWPKDP